MLLQFGIGECNATKNPMEHRQQLHKDSEREPVDATEYRRVIGCIGYLLHTRMDLSYAVGMARIYMEKPTVMHHKAVKQILRYLKGPVHFGLVYAKGRCEEELADYTDGDLAGEPDDRHWRHGILHQQQPGLEGFTEAEDRGIVVL